MPANVHRPARGKVHETLELATGTRDVRAVDRGLVLFAGRRSAAHRAVRGHPPGLLAAGAPVGNRSDDLRNHVAGSLHLHPVALSQVLADDQVFVVERRQLHDHAADLDGLELRVRIERAGATHVDLDRKQSRLGDVRRELARDRPPRLAPSHDAELFL